MMKASRLNSKASSLVANGRLEEAESAYRAALEANSTSAETWHNLGVLCKRQGRWQDAAEAFRKALGLDDSEQSWWWDLGIAATGLEDWDTAREAWKKCDLSLPDGEGPIEADMGRAGVRLNPSAESPEVVWARRVDPARVELRGVPLPTSQRRWKDIVIHDGVPSSSRKLAGQEFPVFDEIRLVTPSDYSTFMVVARIGPRNADRALLDKAEEMGFAAVDWRPSIRFLCETCLQGVPHEKHFHEIEGGERLFGFAARREAEVRETTDAWASEQADCEVVSVRLMVGA